jgi:broad specificity phosphatase PhoE
LVVRHGLTSWNKELRYTGQTDIPLAEEGIAQAEAVGRRLAGRPVCRVYSSDLIRAKMTAGSIARHHDLEVRTDRRLREMHFGEWEGLTHAEIGQKWPGLRDRWLKDPINLKPPGGETVTELSARVQEALRDIYREVSILPEAQESERPQTGEAEAAKPCCVIVCHGGVIRSLLALSSSGSLETMWTRAVRHSSITTGWLGPDGLSIDAWDDVEHLEV